MNGIKSVDASTVSLQLRSLLVFDFLNEYNLLEQTTRKIFERSIPELPPESLQQLYFYYGGKIGTYIEYETHTLRLNSMNFKVRECFKELSVNQIVKIFKRSGYIKEFEFTVESIQRTTTVFPFYDCIIRLQSMRNKLAHEVDNLQFSDYDIVELLSYDQISNESFPLLQNFDIYKMDNMTRYIASNIVYIRKLIKQLNCIEANTAEI